MTEATDVFDDALLASVYDDHNPWAASDEFYLGLAREIGGAVLDLGCGTGRLACRIAAAGLEVVGADPAAGRGGYGHRRDRPALPFLDLGLDGGPGADRPQPYPFHRTGSPRRPARPGRAGGGRVVRRLASRCLHADQQRDHRRDAPGRIAG